ncbi:MAG: hypothetical protein ABIT76_11965 [Chthoniobacterales bacterium]
MATSHFPVGGSGGFALICGVRKLVSLLFILSAGVVLGQESRQENESEGMKRILHPTLNAATDLQDKAFYGGADKGFSTNAGNVKTFHWIDLFRLKAFAGSKKYGANDYWTGDYEAGGKKARTQGNYTIPNADTKTEVKTNPVKEDRDAGKTQETRDYDKNRPFLVPGKSQKVLDAQENSKKALTVDDVRKLLNTTR